MKLIDAGVFIDSGGVVECLIKGSVSGILERHTVQREHVYFSCGQV